MNKQRRMEIDSLRKRIRIVMDELKNIKNCLQSVLDAEENAFDNMPEGLQSSYRGMCSEDAIDSMDSAADSLDEALSSLREIV